MRKYLLLGLLLAVSMSEARAQSLFRKVVFLGNSYTYANNMPLLVAQLEQRGSLVPPDLLALLDSPEQQVHLLL